MLYGMPRDYHRWDGNRFVLAQMPQQGLIPSVRPEASPEIQQQAAVSRSTTLGAPETGGGDRGFSAPNDGGRGMGNVSLADLTPDRGTVASGLGGALASTIAGPVAGMFGSFGGGMAGGHGPGRAGGSALGSLAGLALAGPLGAVAGGLLGGQVGQGFDPMSDSAMAGMISGDFGLAPSPQYEGPMTLEPAIGGSGLGGISPGTGGAMSTTADGTVAGYGALGTPSSYGMSDLGSGDSGGGSSKIVCTAMCRAYGFGSFRQKLWLAQSRDLAPEYQRGYHAIFRPLIERAYRENGPVWLRKTLEHIARHRTADIWKQKRGKRDWIGAAERAVLEPLCYAAGWLKAVVPKRADRSAR
jgi:hypothetical protein